MLFASLGPPPRAESGAIKWDRISWIGARLYSERYSREMADGMHPYCPCCGPLLIKREYEMPQSAHRENGIGSRVTNAPQFFHDQSTASKHCPFFNLDNSPRDNGTLNPNRDLQSTIDFNRAFLSIPIIKDYIEGVTGRLFNFMIPDQTPLPDRADIIQAIINKHIQPHRGFHEHFYSVPFLVAALVGPHLFARRYGEKVDSNHGFVSADGAEKTPWRQFLFDVEMQRLPFTDVTGEKRCLLLPQQILMCILNEQSGQKIEHRYLQALSPLVRYRIPITKSSFNRFLVQYLKDYEKQNQRREIADAVSHDPSLKGKRLKDGRHSRAGQKPLDLG